jgi:hypothetical protein
MAIFYPTIEKINQFKVQPTDGERTLLGFLERTLDDSFEVYFNPFLNGDRPDVLIMRKGYGVMVIEVKDWNLDNFQLNEKRKWVYTPNNSIVKSPIDQVLKYKNNLFDLHVADLLQVKIKDFRNFNIVSCAVYFHCACKSYLEKMLVEPYKNDTKYQKFLKYNIDFLGQDSLNQEDFNALLKKRYLIAERHSWFFTDNLYDNFKRLLSPSLHLRSQGEPYNYSDKQYNGYHHSIRKSIYHPDQRSCDRGTIVRKIRILVICSKRIDVAAFLQFEFDKIFFTSARLKSFIVFFTDQKTL